MAFLCTSTESGITYKKKSITQRYYPFKSSVEILIWVLIEILFLS